MTIRRKLEPKKMPDQLQITRPPDNSLERKQPIYLERRFWKLTDFLVLSTSGSLSDSKSLWQRLLPCPQRLMRFDTFLKRSTYINSNIKLKNSVVAANATKLNISPQATHPKHYKDNQNLCDEKERPSLS